MRAEDLPAIRRLPLFREMSEEAFERLVRGAYLQQFPPQVDLISQGDRADFLHVVVEGAVDLFAEWNGRETVMETVEPVSSFILAATVMDRPYLMSARTVRKTLIVMIPSEDLRAIFASDSDFARAVVSELARCYRTVVKGAKDLKLRTATERLANYLLRENARQGDGGGFELRQEKRRLASFLGMTPENLSRAFGALKTAGVTVCGARIEIARPDDLAELAKPTPLIDDR